jgi:carbonic anhydrase
MVARIGGAPALAAPIYVVQDAFADLFEGNERYAAIERGVASSGVARRGLGIVTCIDSRIDPLAVFGLVPGDAKILRNAGARVTDDVLRTLALAAAALGVTRIAIVQHTECKMASATDEELVAAVAAATGRPAATFEPRAISDQPDVLRADVDRVLASPLVPDGVVVGGLLLDLRAGRLRTIVAPRVR